MTQNCLFCERIDKADTSAYNQTLVYLLEMRKAHPENQRLLDREIVRVKEAQTRVKGRMGRQMGLGLE